MGFRLFALALLSALVLEGCNVGYIARGAMEECRILWNRKPIADQLDNSALSPELRAKLETVLEVRRFAGSQLGLNVGGAYQSLSEVDQRAVVHVVMAARRDSLTPYTWWFPIVGAVPYRGYFEESEAVAEAESMEKDGYDTMVRPAVAFSSLGFFDDPLLSNLLELDRVTLANVLIHELFHRTYFAPSDAMFNESAANYVGLSGAVAFFVSTEGQSSKDTLEAREALEDNLKFARFLLGAQARLLRIYTSGASREQMLSQRAIAFKEIQAEYAALATTGIERYDLDKEPLNNAVLINYLLYFHDLDNFAALQSMNHGDVRATIAQIIAIASAHPSAPFYAIAQAVHGTP